MEIAFKRDDLNYVTSIVHGVVNPASSLPILGNILLRAEKDKAMFIGSDLESCVECTCPAEIKKEGAITIPAETFTSLVRELPASDVTLKTKGSHCLVLCDGNEYNLQTMAPDDFPIWSGFEAVTSFDLPQKTLRRLISPSRKEIPARRCSAASLMWSRENSRSWALTANALVMLKFRFRRSRAPIPYPPSSLTRF